MPYLLSIWMAACSLGGLLLPCAPAQPTPALPWHTLPEALAEARQTRRPVLVYATAPWCGLCRRMERDVFPAVRPLLARFVLAELRFDDHDTTLSLGGRAQTPFARGRDLGIEATPGIALLAPDGTRITHATGYLDAASLSLLLAYVATGAYRHASFATYAAQTAPR
ncbi:MAG: thioredoxin family protein [Bacteroidetes bacterium]|nr:MAG: thioredoxin family protein [Bacteroidota bacterium]